MEACAKKAKPETPVKIPKAKDLNLSAPAKWILPPETLSNRLGEPQLVMGYDLETHDWLEEHCNRTYTGPFGFITTLAHNQLEYQRIVQVGWAIGKGTDHALSTRKCFYVRPEGFEISDKATEKCHGITQAQATQEGRSLTDVLQEFMEDASKVVENGGKLVAHQGRTFFCSAAPLPVLTHAP